jgi:transposase
MPRSKKNTSASTATPGPSATAQPNASGGGGLSSPKKLPRYTDDFKQQAVALVTCEGYSLRQAARAVGVAEKSLRDWCAKIAPSPQSAAKDASPEELRAEIARLRKQLHRAETEREILKKAAIYFANEPTGDSSSSRSTR